MQLNRFLYHAHQHDGDAGNIDEDEESLHEIIADDKKPNLKIKNYVEIDNAEVENDKLKKVMSDTMKILKQ